MYSNRAWPIRHAIFGSCGHFHVDNNPTPLSVGHHPTCFAYHPANVNTPKHFYRGALGDRRQANCNPNATRSADQPANTC
jgi:hypothetical protein